MIRVLWERLRQKHRTAAYPRTEPVLPGRFQGRPVIRPDLCAADCARCAEVCPTEAIRKNASGISLDVGSCLFCGECEKSCGARALTFSRDHRLAVREKKDLVIGGDPYRLAQALDLKMKKLFGRSLKLRQVSAGGCNACEADVNVLNTVVFDLGRFGIQFVASPRHADGLLITGPVSKNMKLALMKTYQAVPSPVVVIAIGACAVSGGPFQGHEEVLGGAARVVPVDLFIPGCPPHPYTILDGLLRFLGRLENA